MIKVYLIDDFGTYVGEMDVDPMQALPRCSLKPPPETTGSEVAMFDGLGWLVLPERPVPPAPPQPTQFELDQRRYQKRAAVQSELIAWMAADNMSRVRSGVWTVADLTSLMSDPAVASAQAYMGTLSYELAAQAIEQATHPLLTSEIKSAWVARLQEHFYLSP